MFRFRSRSLIGAELLLSLNFRALRKRSHSYKPLIWLSVSFINPHQQLCWLNAYEWIEMPNKIHMPFHPLTITTAYTLSIAYAAHIFASCLSVASVCAECSLCCTVARKMIYRILHVGNGARPPKIYAPIAKREMCVDARKIITFVLAAPATVSATVDHIAREGSLNTHAQRNTYMRAHRKLTQTSAVISTDGTWHRRTNEQNL